MKLNSQFFFTGSTVLVLCFFASGEWVMLPIPFFIAFLALWLADREQIAALDGAALAMILEDSRRPVLPVDLFRGRELVCYRGGYPIYRYLVANDGVWKLLGKDSEVTQEAGMIRVFPGYVYQRVDTDSAK